MTDSNDFDAQVRLAAFQHVGNLQETYGEVLPRSDLLRGFQFEGARVPLLGPRGIFKPKVLPEMPLSITTKPIEEGRDRPYEDEWAEADSCGTATRAPTPITSRTPAYGSRIDDRHH